MRRTPLMMELPPFTLRWKKQQKHCVDKDVYLRLIVPVVNDWRLLIKMCLLLYLFLLIHLRWRHLFEAMPSGLQLSKRFSTVSKALWAAAAHAIQPLTNLTTSHWFGADVYSTYQRLLAKAVPRLWQMHWLLIFNHCGTIQTDTNIASLKQLLPKQFCLILQSNCCR